MIGVFSSSDELLAIDIAVAGLKRVVGALDAGADVDTGASDIAEDFFINDVVVLIPNGATHLFLAPLDGFVGDNADDDADLAVRITAVPVPGAAVLLLSGLLVCRRLALPAG